MDCVCRVRRGIGAKEKVVRKTWGGGARVGGGQVSELAQGAVDTPVPGH